MAGSWGVHYREWGVCGWEWESEWLGVRECVDGSRGVCNWEWGNVWQGVGECVDGSVGVSDREWGSVWQGVEGVCRW